MNKTNIFLIADHGTVSYFLGGKPGDFGHGK
jgi:hypothetical protein